MTAIGDLLKARREAAGMSRTKLSIKSGVLPRTIEAYEMGVVRDPPIGKLVLLARALNIDTGELVEVATGRASEPPEDERIVLKGEKGDATAEAEAILERRRRGDRRKRPRRADEVVEP